MKSKLIERRNAEIRERVNSLLGGGRPIMDVYAEVGEEFELGEVTIRHIMNDYGYYSHKC